MQVVLPCRQKDWTGWLNLDTPSLLCDCETLERAVATRGVCTRPTHIEVQLADGRPYTEGGNVVDISLETGFACWNDLQPDGMKCEDYMVRYCCPDEDNSSGDGSGLQVLLGG
ncbi:cartilage intermediate layer protein 2-like [Styela clava]